jgi:hypothetical protein
MYKNSVAAIQKTVHLHYRPFWSVRLLVQAISAQCENSTKGMDAVRGQNAEILVVTEVTSLFTAGFQHV